MGAPSLGNRAGSMHVRVLPDTTGFQRDLKRKLVAIEKSLPSLTVNVEKARVNRTKLAASIDEQVKKLRDFKVNIDTVLKGDGLEQKLKQFTGDKRVNLIPQIDQALLDRVWESVHESIKRIELKVSTRVDDESVRAAVVSLENELSGLERNLHISILNEEERMKIRHRIHEISEKLDDMAKDRTVHVDINPFTAWANARLRWLTRPRIVEIIPKVPKAAFAKAATALAALSGARLSYDYLERFSDWMSEIDRKLPRLAMTTMGLTSAFGGLMSSLSGIVGIGDGLASLLPSLLLIPGMLAGAAMSGVALYVALKDAKSELSVLGPQFTRLGQTISSTFWGQAREPIIELTNSVMPQLERSFERTSQAIGRFTGKLAGSFQKSFAGGRLEAMFNGLASSWDELAKGTDSFAGAITNLGLVAARYMPRLSAWFVRQADTFDNWLSKVATDGRLDQWINEAIDSYYSLWDVAAGTTGVLKGLWTAAEAGGSKGLRGFADMMLAWDKAVNGQKWQETLTSLFRGSGDAMGSFKTALEKVGNMLHSLRSDLEYLIAGSGDALGGLIGSIADALDRPAIQRGLRDFIDGISSGLDSLEPALVPVADLVGKIASFAGELGDVLGSTLGNVAELLAPFVEGFLDKIDLTPLADAIGAISGEGDGMKTVGSALGSLAQFAIDVAASGIETMLPRIVNALEDLAPLLDDIAGSAETLQPLWDGLGALFDTTGVGGSAAAMNSAKSAFEVLDKVDKMKDPKEKLKALTGFWDDLAKSDQPIKSEVGKIGGFIVDVGLGFAHLRNQFEKAVDQFRQDPSGTVTEWVQKLVSALQEGVGGLWESAKQKGGEILDGLRLGLEEKWSSVRQFFIDLPANTITAIGDAAVWLIQSGQDIIGGLHAGASTRWATTVTPWFVLMKAKVQAFLANPGGWLVGKGQEIIAGLQRGVQIAWSTANMWFAVIKGKVISFFTGAGTWLFSSGQALITGFAEGVREAAGKAAAAIEASVAKIRGLFPNSPAKWGPFSGRGWVAHSGVAVGQTFGDSVVKSLDLSRSRIARSLGSIRGEFTTLTGDVNGLSQFDVSSQFDAARSHSARTANGVTTLTDGTTPAAGTSVVANFIQPEQREQFREFAAVVERELKR